MSDRTLTDQYATHGMWLSIGHVHRMTETGRIDADTSALSNQQLVIAERRSD